MWVHRRKAKLADTGRVEALKELELKQELSRLWEKLVGVKGKDFIQNQRGRRF